MGIPGLNGKLKSLGNSMVILNYEIYLSGVSDGRKGGRMPPLKEFAHNCRQIHNRGKQLSKAVVINGERADTAVNAQTGN